MKVYLISILVIIIALAYHQLFTSTESARDEKEEEGEEEKINEECWQFLWNRSLSSFPALFQDTYELKREVLVIYDESNGCKYLDFQEALLRKRNLTVLQELAPPSLVPLYRDRYYRYYIEGRDLEIYKWFHSKYEILRYVAPFLSEAFYAQTDLETLEWLHDILNFTKEEILSYKYLPFCDDLPASITVSTWPLSTYGMTLDEILTYLNNETSYCRYESSIAYLEAFSDYYHLNLTDTSHTSLQLCGDVPDYHQSLHEDFLNFRFKPFNCSKECCLRLIEHSQQRLHLD